MRTLLFLLLYILSVSNTQSQNVGEYLLSGNKLHELKDYRGAILDYTKAIELDPKMGDAYYYRGVAKIAVKEINSGCYDLSKAGELGQEAAYKLIKQFCNK